MSHLEAHPSIFRLLMKEIFYFCLESIRGSNVLEVQKVKETKMFVWVQKKIINGFGHYHTAGIYILAFSVYNPQRVSNDTKASLALKEGNKSKTRCGFNQRKGYNFTSVVLYSRQF